MKIEAAGDIIVLEEVFNTIMFKTPGGNRLGICMRDDSFEINVLFKDVPNWYTIDMSTGKISRLESKLKSKREGEHGESTPTIKGESTCER